MLPLSELPSNPQGSLPGYHWEHVGLMGPDASRGLHGAGKQQRLLEGVDGRADQGGAVPGERQ